MSGEEEEEQIDMGAADDLASEDEYEQPEMPDDVSGVIEALEHFEVSPDSDGMLEELIDTLILSFDLQGIETDFYKSQITLLRGKYTK